MSFEPKAGKVAFKIEEQNKPEQIWNQIASIGSGYFSLKNDDRYLTVPTYGVGFNSLIVEAANYGNDVVVEHSALKDDGICCIDSQTWKRTPMDAEGYFNLENKAKDSMLLTNIAYYQNEDNTGLQMQTTVGNLILLLVKYGRSYWLCLKNLSYSILCSKVT